MIWHRRRETFRVQQKYCQKTCSISTLTDTSIHFAHECSRRTESSVLRVGAKWSYCSWNTRNEVPFTERQLFSLLMPLLVFVWAGDSTVNAPEIGWSQMVPLLKEKHFHCLCWQGETGDCRTTAKNLTLIANWFVTHSSSFLKNIYLPYYVWPHPTKLLTTV